MLFILQVYRQVRIGMPEHFHAWELLHRALDVTCKPVKLRNNTTLHHRPQLTGPDFYLMQICLLFASDGEGACPTKGDD